jgi:hypothetical protein
MEEEVEEGGEGGDGFTVEGEEFGGGQCADVLM